MHGLTQGGGLLASVGEGGEQQVGLLVVLDIAADGLAETLLVAVHVEIVVVDLEGYAEIGAEIVECLQAFGVGSADDGSDLEGCGEQGACLKGDHADVLGDGDGVATLEVHVEGLAFVDVHGTLVECLEHRAEGGVGDLGDELCGKGEHGVAGEDGGVLVPAGVDGRAAAAQIGAVHDVVVQQGEVVEDFDAECGVECGGGICAEGFGSHECEHGTEALAAAVEGVDDGLVERWYGGVDGQG